MKLVVAILTGMLLAVPAARANAEPVDCEAARCTVQASTDLECPCAEAKNHGRYTSCVKKVINRLVRDGSVPKKCRSEIAGCASRSICGKPDGSVACQLHGSPETSRCRPLSSAAACADRGGSVVESCCESCNAPVPTATAVETPVPTETTTPAPVATETASPAPVETETPAPVATETATPEPAATETATPEVVATETPLPTVTEVPVATTTPAPVATETATPGPAATETATPGPAATETATPAPVATETATPGPGVTATATEGPVVTATPTAGPAATATVTVTAVVTATTTPVSTATTTPVPTATTTPVVTATATATPVLTATRTATPVPTVTSTPIPTGTVTPTPASTPFCGDGIVNGTEQCDTAAPQPQCPNSGGALQTCALGCVCPCPGTVAFTGDAEAPESILDTGFTGIAQRAPIITNGDVTIDLNCAATKRPCGTCPVTGPIVNPAAGSGQLDNHRCSSDPSLKCATTATCTAAANKCSGGTNNGGTCVVTACGAPGTCTAGTCVGGPNAGQGCCNGGFCRPTGTCNFYFGSALPLAAGGVSTCVVNQFNGALSGTANVESGDASTTAFLTARVYNGLAVDNPCPRCSDSGPFNDGVTTGTCDAGPRQGFACDANGEVPNRPDFGRTSLDCPPSPAGIIATLAIDLSSKTSTVTKTLTAASPNCSAAVGNKCLCDTCNNANAEVCDDNSDCPDPAGPIGPVCGGKRCLGGPNVGVACNANTECPGVTQGCGRVGEPTKPNGCTDDTSNPGNNVLDCVEGSTPGVGECTLGPSDSNCSVASGHAQRGCAAASEVVDCGGPGTCLSAPRKCFLTGGGTFNPAADQGSDTLSAVGIADAPMNDVSHPTLGAVFCVAPTGAASINKVAGLPGPARVTIKGTARGLP